MRELWLFFFFQAEDGIRDLTVTGVQTCALPIAIPIRRRAAPGVRGGHGRRPPRPRAGPPRETRRQARPAGRRPGWRGIQFRKAARAVPRSPAATARRRPRERDRCAARRAAGWY